MAFKLFTYVPFLQIVRQGSCRHKAIRLLLFSCLLMSLTAHGQDDVRYDNSVVTVRPMSVKELDSLRKLPDFTYTRVPKKKETNLLQRFIEWLFGDNLDPKQRRQAFNAKRIFVWLLIIAVIVFAIMKVVGMNPALLFKRDRKIINYEVDREDINAINFEQSIQEAISQGNYRLATRLMYLQTLHTLSTKGLINWEINKTNHHYQRELSGRPYSDGFKDLTYIFETVWYGEVAVNKGTHQFIAEKFTQFRQQIT
jgi:hypothetical protein